MAVYSVAYSLAGTKGIRFGQTGNTCILARLHPSTFADVCGAKCGLLHASNSTLLEARCSPCSCVCCYVVVMFATTIHNSINTWTHCWHYFTLFCTGTILHYSVLLYTALGTYVHRQVVHVCMHACCVYVEANLPFNMLYWQLFFVVRASKIHLWIELCFIRCKA